MAFFVLLAADFLTVVVKGTKEPVPIKAMFKCCRTHLLNLGYGFVCFCFKSAHTADLRKVRTNEYKQTSDKHGFCYTSFNIGSCLERFAWFIGEAVQVETVVPVCAANQRQAVWSKIVNNMVEGTFQMLEQGSCVVWIAVKRNLFI
ncbi:hypothetical protein D3C76_858910 [compost metagenome]